MKTRLLVIAVAIIAVIWFLTNVGDDDQSGPQRERDATTAQLDKTRAELGRLSDQLDETRSDLMDHILEPTPPAHHVTVTPSSHGHPQETSSTGARGQAGPRGETGKPGKDAPRVAAPKPQPPSPGPTTPPQDCLLSLLGLQLC